MKTFILLIVTLLLVSANARKTSQMLQGTYDISKAVTNPFSGAVYSCLMVHAGGRFGNRGPEWMTGFNSSETASGLAHHTIIYGIDATSSLLQEGGILENVEDGDIVYDCFSVTSNQSPPPKLLHSEQIGNEPLDLLSMFGDDGSTANGYPYGIPVGAGTGITWWAIEFHAHAHEFPPEAQVPIKFHVKGTTDAPDENIDGMVMYGVQPPFPGFPKQALMNIPINSDGQYTITAGMNPAAAVCPSAENYYYYPDAVACESCCPRGGPVYLDVLPFELRMEQMGTPQVKLITSFLHYHHTGVKAETWIVSLDGTETSIDVQTGHGNALRKLNTPLVLKDTDGMKVKCTFERQQGDTTNIGGGYTSAEEMCLGFSYYVSAVPVAQPAPNLLYGSICNTVQNEGYLVENDPMDFLLYLGIPKGAICLGPCPGDVGCLAV